jgi:Holliday junction resolvase RusA-like endonuclease
MSIHLVIDGEPIAKGRPRFSMINGKPITFTPPKTRTFEAMVAMTARTQAPPQPLEGAVSVEMRFFFTLPKSRIKKRIPLPTVQAKDTKPDIDNLIKAILDGLNGAGFWRDDAQIAKLTAFKAWTTDKARIEITISKCII